MTNEFAFIEYLKKKIPESGRVSVGIGDDAAVLNVEKGKKLVVSTDAIVENVDFKIKDMSPEKIGRKALAVNLSDIAAMGAKPVAFVITIGKPKYISETWLKHFYNGLLTLARQYDVACAGGDFSSSKEFFASVAIFGEASPHQIAKRSGAKPGDWTAVTGSLGGSIRRHHYDFTPRVSEGLFLANYVAPTAMIDISDGLVQDLTHILKASRVGAVLDIDKIPISSDAKKMAKGNGGKALVRALSDGENFELLFTVRSRQKRGLEKIWKKQFPKVPLNWIGKVERGVSRISWCRNGKRVAPPKLAGKGFCHF
ncbi:MAG: thiamine-phosphate kinase [Candidatus Omnitrophica bacterium]|nr:thiamine-phosphate kinase [Candidatus Omnitrophota bacterium]